MKNKYSICLITPTYNGDIEQFKLLRQSINKFATDYYHLVIVQSEDFSQFNNMFGRENNITIIKTSDVLPSYLEKRRLITNESKIIHKMKRIFYSNLIAGWYVQQLTKIYALAKCDFDAAVFIDSDVFLCDYLPLDYFYINGSLKLFRKKAFNAEQFDFDICTHTIIGNHLHEITELYDYMFQPTCFKKNTAIILLDKLTTLYGKKWFKRFLAVRSPSEYHLLGYAASVFENYEGYTLVECNPEDIHYSIRYDSDKEKLQINLKKLIDDKVKKPFFLIQSTLKINSNQITEAFQFILEHAT